VILTIERVGSTNTRSFVLFWPPQTPFFWATVSQIDPDCLVFSNNCTKITLAVLQ
jgi:hypothetical protein